MHKLVNMKKKSSPEKGKAQPSECGVCKRCKLNVNQPNEEIINKEELDKRNGIAEGKNDYFSLYLQLFFKGIIIHGPHRSIRQLALFLYNKKELYSHKNNGYKLMKLSSINTDLNTLSHSVQEQLKEKEEKEKKEAEAHKSRFF